MNNLTKIIEEYDKELEKYLQTDEHKYDCIGYSEGQECCLEKKWIKHFHSQQIKKILEEVKEWAKNDRFETGSDIIKFREGYNQALVDLQNYLDEAIKKL